jgi:membrane associated rhomboid family serine protease
MNQPTLQFGPPKITPLVKGYLIAAVTLFLLTLGLEQWAAFSLSELFGFRPIALLSGWVWQPVTYAFLHSGLLHLMFNLLIVWSIGSELEALWGSKTFLGFSLVCCLGAALFYGVFSILGIGPGPTVPVVGSSGVVYGYLLAFGILFGDRTMYFFMLFPMPARYFVAILGAVELVSSIFYGKSGVAHLAHLGGMVFGFAFMAAMAQWRQRQRHDVQEARANSERQKRIKKSAGHLKLVRGEEEEGGDSGPKHWN